MANCQCIVESFLNIPNDALLNAMSGKQLRAFANAHNISPTGATAEGFSRWRNQANAVELRTALIHHRNGTAAEPMPNSAALSNLPQGLDKLPELLDKVEVMLATVDTDLLNKHIKREVDEQVAKYASVLQQVEISLPDTQPVVIESQHKDFKKALRAIAAGVNVLMVGPAGSGKTEAAITISKVLQRDYELISVGPQTMQSELSGYRNAHGDYISSAIYRAYTEGKVLIIDEMDAGNAGVFTFCNAALSNSIAGFPNGAADRHKNFLVIALANTYGTGADMVYIGRSQLDGATLDRYCVIEWDYDTDFEMKLALAHNPEAASWVKTVQKWRTNMMKHKIRHIISPRASINGAKLLKMGFTPDELATMLVFKGLNKEAKDKIMGKATDAVA